MPILNLILHYVGLIPSTFWGVVIGSLFTIGGVALSNRANAKRLQIQLTYDRELKERERQLTLKRDIFLKSAEAIATGCNALSTFANLNSLSETLGREYFDKASTIAQAYLVGDAETISAIESISQEISAAMARLHTQRVPLMITKGKAEAHRNAINLASSEVTRLVEQMKEMNIEGVRDDRRFNELQSNFDFQMNYIKSQSELAYRFEQEVREGLNQLLREILVELSQVTCLIPKAIASVRRELGLPLDEAWLGSVFERGITTQRGIVERFIREMNDSLIGSD